MFTSLFLFLVVVALTAVIWRAHSKKVDAFDLMCSYVTRWWHKARGE